MAGIKFEVAGLSDLLERMKGLPEAVGARALASSGRAAMKPVFEDSVRLCPSDTGILRASLRLAATTKGSGTTGIVSAGVTVRRAKLDGEIEIAEGDVEQVTLDAHADAHWRWHFEEFGTVKMAARPFLRPAFDANVGTVLSIFKTKLAERIERAWQKLKQVDA